MKLEPLGDRILVRPSDEAEEMTEGGLYIPASAQEAQSMGEVVAVGPGKLSDDGRMRVEPALRVGDRVLYGKYAGTTIEWEGEELLVLSEHDLMCRVGT